HVFDGVTDLFPGGVKGFGGFLPREFSRPSGQEEHVWLGEMMLAVAPGNFLDHHAAATAVHAAHAVEEEDQESPEGNEFEAPLREMIVTGRRLVAARADGRRTLAWPNFDFDAFLVLTPARVLINESPVAIAVV